MTSSCGVINTLIVIDGVGTVIVMICGMVVMMIYQSNILQSYDDTVCE